jgi:hypothetical protein
MGEDMANPDVYQPPVEHRSLLRLVFQLVGVADLALGLAIAIWGPGFVGNDPVANTVILICGGGVALVGLALVWFARRRHGGAQSEGGATMVVRTRD